MNDATIKSLDRIFDADDTIDAATGEVVDCTPAVIDEPASIAVIDEPTPEEVHQKLAEEDFHFSRSAIKAIANESQTLLNRAVDVAQQTDAARSFEVAAELIKSVLEAHRELRETHKQALASQWLNGRPKEDRAAVNIQNGIVFNGTPEELLRMIQPDRT